MTGRCHGYGVDPHDHDGATVEVRAPVHLQLCRPCWQRWVTHRPRPSTSLPLTDPDHPKGAR